MGRHCGGNPLLFYLEEERLDEVIANFGHVLVKAGIMTRFGFGEAFEKHLCEIVPEVQAQQHLIFV